MKNILYILLTITLLGTGCAMFKREIERSVKKDVKEYFDENFNKYAEGYHNEKRQTYKNNFGWIVGTTATIIGIVATTMGLIVLIKKKKRRK